MNNTEHIIIKLNQLELFYKASKKQFWNVKVMKFKVKEIYISITK